MLVVAESWPSIAVCDHPVSSNDMVLPVIYPLRTWCCEEDGLCMYCLKQNIWTMLLTIAVHCESDAEVIWGRQCQLLMLWLCRVVVFVQIYNQVLYSCQKSSSSCWNHDVLYNECEYVRLGFVPYTRALRSYMVSYKLVFGVCMVHCDGLIFLKRMYVMYVFMVSVKLWL